MSRVISTVILLVDGLAYERSSAVLALARYLRAPYSWIGIFKILPRAWRDSLYNYIASHRYAWFGKTDACRVPTPELRARFIDATA